MSWQTSFDLLETDNTIQKIMIKNLLASTVVEESAILNVSPWCFTLNRWELGVALWIVEIVFAHVLCCLFIYGNIKYPIHCLEWSPQSSIICSMLMCWQRFLWVPPEVACSVILCKVPCVWILLSNSSLGYHRNKGDPGWKAGCNKGSKDKWNNEQRKVVEKTWAWIYDQQDLIGVRAYCWIKLCGYIALNVQSDTCLNIVENRLLSALGLEPVFKTWKSFDSRQSCFFLCLPPPPGE